MFREFVNDADRAKYGQTARVTVVNTHHTRTDPRGLRNVTYEMVTENGSRVVLSGREYHLNTRRSG